MGYVNVPIEVNAEQLMEDIYDYLRARVPGWEPADGNLDVWIAQAITINGADLAEIASAVPDTIFRYMGAALFAIPPQDATPATVNSTWTMIDNVGYRIPAGTNVLIRDAEGVDHAFEVMTEVIVEAGTTATSDGEVVLVAVEPGADSSGLGADGVLVALGDTLDYVVSVELAGTTTGGVDAESDAEYLDRLQLRLQRLSQRPVLPEDFAAMYLDIPGVARAVAIDGYNPLAGSFNNERMVAVAGVDDTGANLSTSIKTQGQAYMEANREVNFVVNIMDANRYTIDVEYAVRVSPGYEIADVQGRITDALSEYMNPATWGSVDGDPSLWTDLNVVRYFEVAQAISNVAGVEYIEAGSLKIGLSGQARSAADLSLTGPAAIAQLGATFPTVT